MRSGMSLTLDPDGNEVQPETPAPHIWPAGAVSVPAAVSRATWANCFTPHVNQCPPRDGLSPHTPFRALCETRLVSGVEGLRGAEPQPEGEQPRTSVLVGAGDSWRPIRATPAGRAGPAVVQPQPPGPLPPPASWGLSLHSQRESAGSPPRPVPTARGPRLPHTQGNPAFSCVTPGAPSELTSLSLPHLRPC